MHHALSGGLAQLGEHLLCKQGVVGSIPSSSTTSFDGTSVVLVAVALSVRRGVQKCCPDLTRKGAKFDL